MTKRKIADLLFMGLLVVVVVYVALTAQDWPLGARLFPTVLGGLMGVLLVAQIATTLVRARREGHPEDEPIWPGVDPKVAGRRAIATAASIVGMAILVFVLGFPYGGPLALAIHLFLVVRERWLVSSALVVTAFAMIWAASSLLNIPFPEPLLPGLANPF